MVNSFAFNDWGKIQTCALLLTLQESNDMDPPLDCSLVIHLDHTGSGRRRLLSQIGLQSTTQAEPKQRAKSSVWKPLDSDASYICTLSGFGNLAHCYSR